jgi:hypothetical protein
VSSEGACAAYFNYGRLRRREKEREGSMTAEVPS